MATTIPILTSLNPSILRPKYTPFSPLTTRLRIPAVHFSPPLKIQSLKTNQNSNLGGFLFGKRVRVRVRVCVSVKENGGGGGGDEGEEESRGESTMPERFRYLNKEAADPVVKWPWFVALAFLIYAWRAVLLELSNWKKGAIAVVKFVGYVLKLGLALIYHFVGGPIFYTVRFVETIMYAIRAYYSELVANALIPELTTVVMQASAVCAIAEAVVPNSVNCQPILLTLSGLVGYAVVFDYFLEPFFYTILVGLYGFSRFVKKRDDVTSVLPSAAVLAAVGQPWIRAVVILSFLALAIFNHSKKLPEKKEDLIVSNRKLPLPLLGVALAIGIRLAANWAGYRHLTWKIV